MSAIQSDSAEDEPPPKADTLTCLTKEGEPYRRHQGVEEEIATALQMPYREWTGQRWRLETLAHLIRLRARDNDLDVLGRLTLAFLEQAKPVVDRWSRGYGPADTEEIQIEVSNQLGDLLMKEAPTRTSEYLEVDAATVIKQVTLRIAGKDRSKAFSVKSIDDETSTFEPPPSEALNPLERLLENEEAKKGGLLRFLNAITDPRHRDAFILRVMYDWPVKDAPPGVPTLCSRFSKSDRQIRNWLKKATEQVRAAHGAES